jgi:hypothetical protein
MKTFFNTTEACGEELRQYTKKASTQDEVVEAFFLTSPAAASPEQVWLHCYKGTTVPLTSVRRSVSNLEKAGKLMKNNEKVTGKWIHVKHKREDLLGKMKKVFPAAAIEFAGPDAMQEGKPNFVSLNTAKQLLLSDAVLGLFFTGTPKKP